MGNTAKVVVLHDNAYVSPYLMRPLRRLDEVERAHGEAKADDAAGAKDARSARRQNAGPGERVARPAEAGRR